MVARSSLRIVSLLPSLTEIAVALGFEKNLVGRSHECDFPETAQMLPVCSEPKFKISEETKSTDINQSVNELLREGLSVYRVDEEKLRSLKPDVILTQDHCEVCAVSFSEVDHAVKTWLGDDTTVISVSPADLDGVRDSFRTVARELGVPQKGDELVADMNYRFENIRQRVQNTKIPSVAAIEWMDPLMTAGNWMPELIDIASGRNLLSDVGEHSPAVDWQSILKSDPEVLLIIPCGYTVEQTMKEIDSLTTKAGWNSLTAVQNNSVYILDGHNYFNRPGPRLADSAEILAEILHPDEFGFGFENTGWIRWR